MSDNTGAMPCVAGMDRGLCDPALRPQSADVATSLTLTRAERRIAWLMGAVQLLNILSFMMVIPLAPDLAGPLNFPPAHVGLIGGVYMAAAAVSGLVGALFLDRFDRRTVLAVTQVGIVIGNALSVLAWDLPSLLATRVLAGLCSGPAAAVALAIVGDSVAIERRGQAMGIVMGAFSASSVIGVPFGLEMARLGGWRLPFVVVAATGIVIITAAQWILPPQTSHLGRVFGHPMRRLVGAVRGRIALLGLALSATTSLGHFMLVPNLAAHVQFNLGLPRAQLSLLYLIGGSIGFFGMRITGWFVDRFGASPVTIGATSFLAVLIYLLFVDDFLALPVLALAPALMTFSATRFVAQQATISKVPSPDTRAGYIALISAITNLASGLGAFIASLILVTRPDGGLGNMAAVGLISIGLVLMTPVIMVLLERALNAPRA